MSKLDILSDPMYSLANNDSLRMAIQNKSLQVLGRADPCPLVGSVVPPSHLKSPPPATSKTTTMTATITRVSICNHDYCVVY